MLKDLFHRLPKEVADKWLAPVPDGVANRVRLAIPQLPNVNTSEIRSRPRCSSIGVAIAAVIAAAVKGLTIPVVHVRVIPRAVSVSGTTLIIILVTIRRVIPIPVIVCIVPVASG